MVLSLFSTRIQIICTVNDLDFNYQNTKFTCHCTGLVLLPLPDWWSWERKFHSCVSCIMYVWVTVDILWPQGQVLWAVKWTSMCITFCSHTVSNVNLSG